MNIQYLLYLNAKLQSRDDAKTFYFPLRLLVLRAF